MRTETDLQIMARMRGPWVCPDCKVPLESEPLSVQCPDCRVSWPIVDGVVRFKPTQAYWGEPGLTREVMQQLLREMGTRRWDEVFRDHPSPLVRQHYRFISNAHRADWRNLVRLKEQAIILDVGAGLGTLSYALSKSCGRVYALERVEERVAFMRRRFEQDRSENIVIVQSDLDTLPFPNDYFDLVVLNGVLEWLPFSRKREDPRRAQVYYLRALFQLLKPGGTVYIGIENRTSYELLAGGADPHLGIKWVGILPRFVADLICKYKTDERYRPYLYSWPGYRVLLAEAGFRTVDAFAACPSYNDPAVILSLQENSRLFVNAVWRTNNPISRLVKAAMTSLDLLKYLAYAYILLARK